MRFDSKRSTAIFRLEYLVIHCYANYAPVIGRIRSFAPHRLTRIENPLRKVHAAYIIMTRKLPISVHVFSMHFYRGFKVGHNRDDPRDLFDYLYTVYTCIHL